MPRKRVCNKEKNPFKERMMLIISHIAGALVSEEKVVLYATR